MKTWMKVFIGIIIVCIIGGSALGIGAFQYLVHYDSDVEQSVETNVIDTTNNKVDSFNHIHLDIKNMDVVLEQMDGYEISYGQNHDITYYVENDTLYVTENCTDCNHDADDTLVIYVPNMDTLDIQNHAGDIEINNLTIKSLNMNCMSGDLEVNNGSIETGTIQSNSGDVTLEGVLVSSALNIHCTSGDVDLVDLDDVHLDLQTTSGEIDDEDKTSTTKDIGEHTGTIQVITQSGDISTEG